MFTEEELTEFEQEGSLLIERMELQSGFNPQITDLLIEKSEDLPGIIEVFIDSRVDYGGNNTFLSDLIQGYEFEFPGNCRRVLQISLGLTEIGEELIDMDLLSGKRVSKSEMINHTIELPEIGKITDFDMINNSIAESGFQRIILNPTQIKDCLGKKIIGQKQPVRVIANTLSSHVAKTVPSRPLVFFALGPTGVGKTRTTEVIPSIIKELEDGLSVGHLRFDMNEFKENHRISQILGAPPGYVGYSPTSIVSDVVESNDITVLVFDEIEKAHPDFLQVLMNAIDTGRLSAGSGVVDLRKTIIMFTSNIGVNEGINWTQENEEESNQFEINQHCRSLLIEQGIPIEIVGRVQDFLLYGTLTQKHRAEILVLSIQEYLAEFELNVHQVDPGFIINFLNSKGLSSPFGGRQYRAAIGESLQPNINDFFLHNPAYRGPIFIDISGTISISENYSEDIEMQEEE
tara:strand:+ start:1165 stop:2544 length:1380 start_codon:yes stop_codon:yes gene_type:complete